MVGVPRLPNGRLTESAAFLALLHDAAAAPAPAKGGVMDKVNEFLDRPVATIGDAIEKITHTGAHAADAKVDPGAPASGSPKVVEAEVVKPPPS